MEFETVIGCKYMAKNNLSKNLFNKVYTLMKFEKTKIE